MASNRGHFLRSSKSSAEVPVFCPLSLVVNFPSGIFKNVYHVEVNSKYALLGLVWFGGHPNQLQRSPLHCPWCGIFKKVYHVGVNMHYLVWFGGHPNQLQRSPLQCPWSGVFKKVYHVGVNIDYLGCLHWRLQLEVTMISCRGHPNQLQRSPLHCPWCGIFKKV